MLAPKRAKYRKVFRGKCRGYASRGTTVDFGSFGLKATTGGWVTSHQIESARRTLTRTTSRGGRVWIRIFPDKPVTKKPSEVKMGGGKGSVYDYVAVVKPGRILFEMGGVPKELAQKAMKLAGAKLPVLTRFVEKQ